ncbi:uncharacterized protein ELE39_002467 [Cryptosporidium sp. chipmunk genotype I]|uniref:uncharacterized protein n=1 Tax=Cryptosporidium sp. chipmunk genotype I TaxID=1280935 RepID=UPI00351A7BCC|nr:hypothetical protein ELE39_002467 [Cryptosporidium sp. chipmunk genotype I]
MNTKTCVLGAIGCIILAIGGVLSSESDLYGSSALGSVAEGSSSMLPSNEDSISGDDLQGILSGSERTAASGSAIEASNFDLSKSQSRDDLSAYGEPSSHPEFGGEPSEGPGSSSSVHPEITVEPSVSKQKSIGLVDQPAEVSKPEEKSSKVEYVITKSAEMAIENLFPTLESASILTVSDISKYPGVELNDEKVLESQLSKNINYYKVEPPMTHDTISGLSTSDPRVEIGVKAKFELLVDENQPRMRRILTFLDSNPVDLTGLDKIDLATLLFSVVTYGECIKRLNGINSNLDVVEICTQLSREDALTIQPEDLPKNLLKEKIELFKLTGAVLSIPLPLFTEASNLKWRHVSNPNGIYQVYNSGAIDGFVHFNFIYKKLYDITASLHHSGFQFIDDVRIELHYGLRGIRMHLGSGEQTRRVKRNIENLMEFYDSWFKGPKSKRLCSQNYYDSLVAMGPIYDAIHEISKILKSIQKEIATNPSIIEEEFNGISKHSLINIHVNERKFLTNNVIPIFSSINRGVETGQIKVIRSEILRILAILEEIEFNSKEVTKVLQDLHKCIRMSGNNFNYELGYIKRDYYRLVKVVRKTNPKYPFPLPSSPLYIKGRKFGIRNLFRKNSARAKLGYYREVNPFSKSEKSSKK